MDVQWPENGDRPEMVVCQPAYRLSLHQRRDDLLAGNVAIPVNCQTTGVGGTLEDDRIRRSGPGKQPAAKGGKLCQVV